MGFREVVRTILAGSVLIAEAIQSQNFVDGVSGWQIAANGNAQFSNGTFRGDLIVGGTTPPNMQITANVPAELTAFYTANYTGTIASFSVIMRANANDYMYQVLLTSSTLGNPSINIGWSRSGVVTEMQIFSINAGIWQNFFGFVSNGDFRIFGTITLCDPSDPTNDLLFGTVSLPRGEVFTQNISSFSFTSTTALTEQLAATIGPIFFANGRAFKIEYSVGIKSAVTQAPGVNIHKTNLAGTTLVGGRWPIPFTGVDLPLLRESIIINNSGTDVNASIAIGVQPQVATAVTLETGAGIAGGYIRVTDIGSASLWTGRPSV